MNAVGFAWRGLVRQPARASLGILGVAAVGALLFDMLLLSEGLIVSMRDLLDRTGYDVRVTASSALPRTGPRIEHAMETLAAVSSLPQVRSAVAVRFAGTRLHRERQEPLLATFEAVSGDAAAPWDVVDGNAPATDGDIVINQEIAQAFGVEPGDRLPITADCGFEVDALAPYPARIAGIAEFSFALGDELTIGGTMATLDTACGGNSADQADMLLVVSTGDADTTAQAIATARPEVTAATNEQMLGRIEQGGFTYFRQISTVLTTVTLAFSMLLITVLLTVSVNQRLGEIAALRALGFSRTRVVADVLSESALIVGAGGALSLPLGWLLAIGLDAILRGMPGIPAQLHFFVYQPAALATHVTLLAITAIVAALYPMRIVARLPIAATLRAEVVG